MIGIKKLNLSSNKRSACIKDFYMKIWAQYQDQCPPNPPNNNKNIKN